jgi:hypothetical protein
MAVEVEVAAARWPSGMALVFVLDGLLLRIEDQRRIISRPYAAPQLSLPTLPASSEAELCQDGVDQQPKDRCHRMLYASISSEAELCDFLE